MRERWEEVLELRCKLTESTARGGWLAQGVEIVAVRVVSNAKVEVRKTGLLVVGAGCISNTQGRRRSPHAP